MVVKGVNAECLEGGDDDEDGGPAVVEREGQVNEDCVEKGRGGVRDDRQLMLIMGVRGRSGGRTENGREWDDDGEFPSSPRKAKTNNERTRDSRSSPALSGAWLFFTTQ